MAEAALVRNGGDAAAAPPATPDRVDLALDGMTCAACAARIETTLNRLPGVQASVNFATESARVDYDRAQAGVDALLAAVTRAGYGARVKRDDAQAREREAARRGAQWRALRRELVAAAVLTAPFVVQMIVMFLPGAAHDGRGRFVAARLDAEHDQRRVRRLRIKGLGGHFEVRFAFAVRGGH